MKRFLPLVAVLVGLTAGLKTPPRVATRQVRPTRVEVVLPQKRTPAIRRPPPTRPADPEKSYASEYWYDPRIHNWGNIGPLGFCHAFLAPLATWAIDQLSYGGMDVREVALAQIDANSTVLDLCCGVGAPRRCSNPPSPRTAAAYSLPYSRGRPFC